MRDINDYTEKYTEEPFEATMVGIRKKTVIEQCKKYGHDTILEIGCGMDPFFMDFKDYKAMIIAEPGDSFADNADRLAALEGKKIQTVRGFLEDKVDEVKGIAPAIDFIILSSVLHELDDPQKMLKAIMDLCSRDTVVHINVPNAGSMHRLIAKEAGLISDVHEQSGQMIKMQRRRTYDMESLKKEVTSAGFDVLEAGSYFIKPFTHDQMQRCLDEGIIDDRVIEGLEKLIRYMPEYGAGIYVNVKAAGKE